MYFIKKINRIIKPLKLLYNTHVYKQQGKNKKCVVNGKLSSNFIEY